jgi:hypothetical protein
VRSLPPAVLSGIRLSVAQERQPHDSLQYASQQQLQNIAHNAQHTARRRVPMASRRGDRRCKTPETLVCRARTCTSLPPAAAPPIAPPSGPEWTERRGRALLLDGPEPLLLPSPCTSTRDAQGVCHRNTEGHRDKKTLAQAGKGRHRQVSAGVVRHKPAQAGRATAPTTALRTSYTHPVPWPPPPPCPARRWRAQGPPPAARGQQFRCAGCAAQPPSGQSSHLCRKQPRVMAAILAPPKKTKKAAR